MDVSTFYALFSATCFTLLGLWWSVVQRHEEWFAIPACAASSAASLVVMAHGLVWEFMVSTAGEPEHTGQASGEDRR